MPLNIADLIKAELTCEFGWGRVTRPFDKPFQVKMAGEVHQLGVSDLHFLSPHFFEMSRVQTQKSNYLACHIFF